MDAIQLKEVEIYTDGACVGNPGPGGYAAILLCGQHRRELFRGYRRTTNNRMEMMAAIAGLHALKYRCCVTIYSDSQLLVNAVMQGWINDWKAHGWQRKKGALRNADLWQQLWDLCDQHEVAFAWIKGHAGFVENERADRLAMLAACQDELVVDEAYENQATSVRNPLTPSLFDLQPEEYVGTAETPSPAAEPQWEAEQLPSAVTVCPPEVVTSRTPKDERSLDQGDFDAEIQRVGSNIQVQHGQETYVWDWTEWYDAQSFTIPPTAVIHKLNQKLADYLAADDDDVFDMQELIRRAVEARDALQYGRSERLARRVLKLEPNNPVALGVLCATLRARGKPQQALDETEAFAHLSYPPLLTSRAAAFCDLRRWRNAKQVIGRALAIRKSDEAFNVVRRIKAAFPELY